MIALSAFVAQGFGHEEIVNAGRAEEVEINRDIGADLDKAGENQGSRGLAAY
jgi:hypothetical protein